MEKVKNYLKGFFFIFGLFFSATFGSIFIMLPSYIFLLVNKLDWFRKYNDAWGGFWLTLPGAMLELLFGTKIVIKGDVPDSRKDCPLIIINHRCRLDWMFYWMAIQRTGRLYNEKIIMKRELKFVPGPGWAMQNLMYCFLQRRWEEDESYLDRIVNYFIDINYPLQFFLFPEGTDLCKESVEKSDRYAEKNKLPKYKYVLHPRVKGFNYLVQKMRKNLLNSVYDVTIGFPYNLCYGEMDLVRGNFPKEVHFLLKRYDMNELPQGDEKLNQWCLDKWAAKEKCLEDFYQNKKFNDDHKNVTTQRDEAHCCIEHIASILFWFAFIFGSFYLCWTSWFCLIYAVLSIVFYSLQNMRGGTDGLLLDFHEKFKKGL